MSNIAATSATASSATAHEEAPKPYIVRFQFPDPSFSFYNIMRRGNDPYVALSDGRELLVLRTLDGANQVAQLNPTPQEGLTLLNSKTKTFQQKVGIRLEKFQPLVKSQPIDTNKADEELIKIIDEIRKQKLVPAPKVAQGGEASPESIPGSEEEPEVSMEGSQVIVSQPSSSSSVSASTSAGSVASASAQSSAVTSTSCASSAPAQASLANATENLLFGVIADHGTLKQKLENLEAKVDKQLTPRLERIAKTTAELVNKNEEKDAASSLSPDNDAPGRFATIGAFFGRIGSGLSNLRNRTVSLIKGQYGVFKESFFNRQGVGILATLFLSGLVYWMGKYSKK